MYLGQSAVDYESLGDIPGVSALTNLVGPLAMLFGGKPSNFAAWSTFDSHAHLIGVGGDKPNANTSGMANAVGQGVSQLVSQYEQQGVRFNVSDGDFAVMIGQRDPSTIYHPLASGDRPNLKLGAQAAATVGGPGDVNGAINGTMNWLKQYMSGNPSALTSAQSAFANASARQVSSAAQAFSPLTQLQAPQSIYPPSFGIPQASAVLPAGGFAQAGMVDFRSMLPYLGAAAGFVLLMTMIQNKPQTRLRQGSGAVKRSARRATRR